MVTLLSFLSPLFTQAFPCPQRLFTGHTDGVSSLEITPDGKKLVSGGLDSSLRVWDLNTAQELASYQFSTQIYCLSICPGESWLAVGYSLPLSLSSFCFVLFLFDILVLVQVGEQCG
jgi:WD40 repeat protein